MHQAHRPNRLSRPLRVVLVPGLHGSGPVHWQSWMHSALPGSVRTEMADWSDARLAPRAQAIAEVIASDSEADWIAVAHSLGCLAVAEHAQRHTPALRGALLVAPASPLRFGQTLEACRSLPFLSLAVVSRNDPWLAREESFTLAQRWGSRMVDAGPVGHLNVEAGFGPWPYGLQLLERMQRELHAASCSYAD
jgi:predicted alpha/beta hydrolase family esterase